MPYVHIKLLLPNLLESLSNDVVETLLVVGYIDLRHGRRGDSAKEGFDGFLLMRFCGCIVFLQQPSMSIDL